MDTTYRLSQTGKEVQALLDQVTPNEQAIAAETERAEAAEQQLQNNIDAEKEARIADVDEEQARAEAAEAALGQRVTAETERAEAAEQQLQNNIDTEEQARIADVDEEQARAEAAEAALGQRVTAETERAEAAERTLQNNINAEEQARIADVDEEQARAEAAESALGQRITNEQTRAEGAEQTLQDNIGAEETARIADVDTEEQRARAAEALLQQHIDDAISGAGGDVSAEQHRAESAEQQLQTNIDAEEQARIADVDTEEQRARAAEQQLQNNINAEQQRAEGVEGDLQADIDDINDKIPQAATAQNQLADKAFVNSSIQTATAEFKGTYNSIGELEAVPANANDYGYVVSTDPEGNTVYRRYKYVEGIGWQFEYALNNSSFTAAQWAAIQSGITAVLVSKLSALPAYQDLMQLIGAKQDALTFDTTPTANSLNPVQSGGIYHALEDKQDKLTFDDQPTQYSDNPVKSGALYSLFATINSLIPQGTTTQNPLASESYVDGKVQEAAADFVGVFASFEQLEQQTGMTVNDFAFVTSTDAAGNTNYTRYDYNGAAWTPVYTLSSNNFTAAQWASINSGITAALVAKLGALPTNDELTVLLAGKQATLTFDTTPTQGSTNPVTSEGIANAILAASGVQFVNVQTLPTASASTMGKIYLVPNATDPNASDWYVTIYDGSTTPATYTWQQVNTTSVDLSNYYTKQEVNAIRDDLQAKDNEKNVTIEAQSAPTTSTLTYTDALGDTVNHIVGDKRVVPNPESESGYDVYFLVHLANGEATWAQGSGGAATIRQKLWINLNSNQHGDTSLNGLSVKVETSDGETVLDTTWQGDTLYCQMAPLLDVTVTVGTKAGYYLASTTQTFESQVAGERTLNFNYQTCVVNFLPTSNQGAGDTTIESATGTINGVAVNYGDTMKVAYGQSITVVCDALTNYATPANYTGTADSPSVTPTLLYQTTLVTVSWESNLGTDPVIAAVQATVAGRQVSSGTTIKVATGSTVSVVFPDVQGYLTPSIADFTAEGTSIVKPTVQYQTDIYTVSVDSNQTDKTDIENVEVEVAYGQTTATLSDGGTIKVPTGTVPTATATTVNGYRKTVTVSAATKTITVQYDTTVVSVNATSNQSTQQQTDPVLSGLTFEINGTEVAAGVGVKVPTGDTLAITAPNIANYAKTVTADATASGSSMTAIVAYQATLVALNMVSNIAGIETSAPSGAQGTVSYDGGTDQTIQNGQFAKVPTGTAFTITYAAISNYQTPTAYSGTAAGTSMTATKAEYVQGVVTVAISMSDSDSAAQQLAGATVSINGGTPIQYTGAPIAVAPLSQVVVHFTDVEGYTTPADQTFIMPTGTKAVTAEYETTIYTVLVTSNQPNDATIAAKTVSVSYTGLATPKTVGNNGTVKVPTGLTPTATAADETGYAKEVTVSSAQHTITAAYQTTIVSVNMVAVESGSETTAPQGAEATVSYQGGADQTIDNSTTAKVPTGTAFTVTYAAVANYGTPASYSATASGTTMQAPKAQYVNGAVTINMSMSDNDSDALALAKAYIAVDGGTPVEYAGSPVAIAPGSEVEVTFDAVEGYATPATRQFTMPSTAYTVNAEYQTNIYTVYVTSNQQNDSTIAAKTVSVSYTGLAAPKTVGNNGTVKVPYGLSPVVTADDVTGYAKSVNVNDPAKTITAAYQTTLVNLNMVGENAGVEGTAPTGAQGTVSYSGGADQVLTDNLMTAKVPTGTAFTVTYAAVSGYATPATYSATASGTSMTATKATYVYGALQLTVSMSDSDATALASVAPQISINSGAPQAMTGSGGVFTVNLEAGDTYEITFNSLVDDGYQTPAAIIGTFGGGVETKTATYQTNIYTVGITSNQGSGDAAIASKKVTVNYTGLTTAKEVSNGGTVKVPANLTPTATADDIANYAKSVTVDSNANTITAAYSTTLVGVNMVGVNNGVEGAAPTGAGATVKYQGGTDQHIDNSTTAKVPTGTAFTIEYADVQNYSTPATYSGTAAGTSMTATKAQYIYGVLNVDVTMSDNDNTDLALVTANIIVNGGSATAMQGTIDTTNHKMTFQTNLDAGDTYEVIFGTVQGYATPAALTGTKGSGVETVTAEYETDIYTLSVTDQNRSETIEYVQGGQTVSNSVASGNSIKVPTGTTPTVASAYVKGYARSVTIGTVTAHAATITVAYTTTVHTVVMTSNQTGDAVISALQATVAWTYDGHSESETLDSGDTVNVPTGVTPTITFPDATGYTKTVTNSGTTHTAAYTTEIVTVALASDTGQADLSGVTITVTDTTASAAVSPFATRQYKIPSGHGYKVEVSDDVEGYAAPAAVTGTATSGTDAAQTVTMTYEEQAGFVDLGLPSGKKWAVGNLVKDSQGNYSIGEETDWGTYVSWGNIIGHNEGEGYNFDQTTYDSTPGMQVAANIPSNDAAHDIALATLGTPWHLPTKEDFQELYDNTDNEWTTINGVAGRKFMKKTDHSVYVFFPASGYYNGTSLSNRGSSGYYWSASFNSSTSAYSLFFNSSSVYPQYYNYRHFGFTVRPVQ